MSRDEVREIVERGGALLNVDFSAIAEQLVTLSFGFPGVCQDLCHHACIAAGIEMTSETTFHLTSKDLQAALDEYLEVCTPSIRNDFAGILSDPRAEIPAAFSKAALDIVAAKEHAGVRLEELIELLSQSMAVSAERALEIVERLAEDGKGLLRFDRSTALIQFKEPMYLVYYHHASAAANKAPAKKALLATFLKIMGGN
jgi:hypothetical protein